MPPWAGEPHGTLLIDHLAQQRMPEDMRGDLDVLLRREVRVGLPGDAPQEDERLGAVEPLAAAVGHGLVPLAAVVVPIKLRVEGQETGEVVLLGVHSPFRLPRYLRPKIGWLGAAASSTTHIRRTTTAGGETPKGSAVAISSLCRYGATRGLTSCIKQSIEARS